MNIIFAGYRKWSHKILENLLKEKNDQWKIVASLTPLNPEGNFKKLPIPCIELDPTRLNDVNNNDILKIYKPDLFLFYGWSWMIPESLYTSHICLCLHTSPLPKYRGGSPLQHQIIRGEKTSAISIFRVVKDLDAGDIYGQKPFSLKGTMDQIFDRIVEAGTSETINVLNGLVKDTLRPFPQEASQVTFFKRRRVEESELTITDFKTKTADELYDFIRALGDPYPNAFIRCKDGKKLFLTDAIIEND